MGESHDQPRDKKEDMTAKWGSVADNEEEPLWKISQDFLGGGGGIYKVICNFNSQKPYHISYFNHRMCFYQCSHILIDI